MNIFTKLILKLIHKPGLSLSLGFAVVILLGAFFLMLPQATVSGDISFIDAVFTATTAVCVTGLAVLDIAVEFTRFGQTVLLVLMQIGAFGIITATVIFFIMIKKKIGIAYGATLRRSLDIKFTNEAVSLVKFIFIFVFSFELIGALLLFFYWDIQGISGLTKVFYSIFHSVSAFANAGLSLFSDSFYGFRYNAFLNIIISILIITGGLGFMVFDDLKDYFFSWVKRGFKTRKLYVHTKLMLIGTIIFIFIGIAGLLIFERNNPDFSGNPILVSYFQSVTTRTAGFSTVDIGNLSHPTYLLFMALMFVGGGSGSTAGGVKGVNIVILFLMFWAFILNKKRVSVFGRTLSGENLKHATAVFIFALFILLLFSGLLLYTEKGDFRDINFEAFSAFGTVGLSAGITPNLTYIGKILIILLMFLGRIGPLAIVMIISGEDRSLRLRYPKERVVVG